MDNIPLIIYIRTIDLFAKGFNLQQPSFLRRRESRGFFGLSGNWIPVFTRMPTFARASIKLLLLLGCFLVVTLLFVLPVQSWATSDPVTDDTMLMLVGEAEPVTTVAARQPEAPITAPAMLTTITRIQIEAKGWRTVAEILGDQPGFFMVSGGRGTIPYLRGQKNAVLFLYDGVPITTDVTKSYAALDGEISLDAVERIEILRGAGSVLWGADAFAGVVNIVPRRFQNNSTAEINTHIGNNNIWGGNVWWGQAGKKSNYSLFFSTKNECFNDCNSIGGTDSTYNELAGNFNIGKWFHLSGRWSDFERHYSMNDSGNDLRWSGTIEAPFNYLKMAINYEHGASHYSLNSFIQETDYRVLDADIERQQHNRMYHAELLWDRRVFDRGLFTLGASLRYNIVTGAMVKDGFFPDFLQPQEPLFTPTIEQEDFSNRLYSIFSQFRYQWGTTQWWAGLRFDDHNSYDQTLSYSIGFARPLVNNIDLKIVYGTAYRTPYSIQLVDERELTPEMVKTLTVQCGWLGDNGIGIELTLFYSNLIDLRYEDPYGGLSEPIDSEVYGGELSVAVPLNDKLGFNAALSLTAGNDDDAEYRVLNYSYVRPDLSTVQVYDQWEEPFDTGPNWMVHAGFNWKPFAGQKLSLGARIGGDYDYSHAKGAVQGTLRQPLIVDANYRYTGSMLPAGSLQLRITNLFDRDYEQADIYGSVSGVPLRATLLWKYRF